MAEILEIWYVAFSFTKFVQNGPIPGDPAHASKIFLNLRLQAQLLEIWYVALPCCA